MKEFTIEQKAQRYDEAISMAKKFCTPDSNNTNLKATLEMIFPELKESKDERIRKQLIVLVKSSLAHTDEEINEMIAWLEKQGEQKPADKVEPKFKCGDRVKNEKSGVTQILGSCIEDVYEGAFPFRIKDQDDWELVEQKHAWSEEDVSKIDRLIMYFKGKDNKEFTEWFSLLKNRVIPQPKQEWSEKDEKTWEELIEEVKDQIDSVPAPDCRVKEDEKVLKQLNKWLTWLKSLKERCNWKPSDEQMDALHYVTNFDYGGHKATLVSLYEQLKKLRGE